jgi:hypothetical protein
MYISMAYTEVLIWFAVLVIRGLFGVVSTEMLPNVDDL